MFALFFSLYLAMFTGTWNNISYNALFVYDTNTKAELKSVMNALGKLVTSIFGDTNYATLGDDLFTSDLIIKMVAFALALITSIGIVVVAVKGIKRLFTVFFYGVR